MSINPFFDMENQQKVEKKFEKLLDEGRLVFQQSGWDGKNWSRHPSVVDYLRFRSEASNLIARVCGIDSVYYKELATIASSERMGANSYYFHMCYGVVEAAFNDYKEGFLFDLKSLITAELLGDFLEQAESLLNDGYIVPAASLAGAILEDALRTLCIKHDIDVPERTKIDSLNISLAKKGVYNKLIQKRITAIADIRNNADHGNYDQFVKDDVIDMVQWIRRFDTDYLA